MSAQLRIHGNRMPARRVLEQNLAAIAQGFALPRLSAGNQRTETLLLPLFAKHPRARTGGKTSTDRLHWDGDLAVPLLDHLGETLTWTMHDKRLGEVTGAVQINPNGSVTSDTPNVVCETKLCSTHDIQRASYEAQWKLLEALEPYVHTAVASASYRIAEEIYGDDSPAEGVLDEVEKETSVNRLLFGVSGDSSILKRLILRAADPKMRPGTGDITAYLSLNIWSAARSEVKRAIGDPSQGGKIRRLWSAQNAHNLAELKEIVNDPGEDSPRNRIGLVRIAAALTASRTSNANSVALEAALVAGEDYQ